MTAFATYTGKTRPRSRGREISEETRALRDALTDSAETGQFKEVPGSAEKAEQTKWVTRIKSNASVLQLKIKLQLTDDGNLAFQAYDPNKPAVEPPASKPTRKK